MARSLSDRAIFIVYRVLLKGTTLNLIPSKKRMGANMSNQKDGSYSNPPEWLESVVNDSAATGQFEETDEPSLGFI